MARQSSHPFETLQFLSRRSEKFGKCNLESVFEKENFDITPLIMDACRDLLASGELSSPEAKKVRDWLRPWGEELGEFLPWSVWEALQSPNPGGALAEVAKHTSSLPEGVERYELEAGIDQAIFNLPNAHELAPLETFAKEIIPAAAEL